MSLEAVLGYEFGDPQLLRLALTHRSISSDNPDRADNERLEFLGDAVLQLVVTNRLYSSYPALAEGKLAKVRAAVVSGQTLASIARDIDLGVYVEVSPSEAKSGGRDKSSILADTLEAIIGAIYLDSGFEAATEVIHRLWGETIDEKAANPGVRDFKTRLQEILARDGRRPVYSVTGEGPDHDRSFAATVLVDGVPVGSGEGRSKKAAEQAAAEEAISSLS